RAQGAHVLVAVLAKEIQRPTQTSPITAQRLSWFPSRRRPTSPAITITAAGIAIRFHFLHSFESLRFSSLVYSHSFESLRFSSNTRCLCSSVSVLLSMCFTTLAAVHSVLVAL